MSRHWYMLDICTNITQIKWNSQNITRKNEKLHREKIGFTSTYTHSVLEEQTHRDKRERGEMFITEERNIEIVKNATEWGSQHHKIISIFQASQCLLQKDINSTETHKIEHKKFRSWNVLYQLNWSSRGSLKWNHPLTVNPVNPLTLTFHPSLRKMCDQETSRWKIHNIILVPQLF